MSDIKSIIEELDYFILEYSSLSALWQIEEPVKQLEQVSDSVCTQFLALFNHYTSLTDKYFFDENIQFSLSTLDESIHTISSLSDCTSENVVSLLSAIIIQRKNLIAILKSDDFDRNTQNSEIKLDNKDLAFTEILSDLIKKERRTLINISRSIYDIEKDKMTMRSLSRSIN